MHAGLASWNVPSSELSTFVMKNVKALFTQLNKCGDILGNKSSTFLPLVKGQTKNSSAQYLLQIGSKEVSCGPLSTILSRVGYK